VRRLLAAPVALRPLLWEQEAAGSNPAVPTDVTTRFAAVAIASLAVGAIGVGVSCGVDDAEEGAPGAAQETPRGDVGLEELGQFDQFPLYWVTETFEDLPLSRTSLTTPETLASEGQAPVSTMGDAPQLERGVFPEFVDLIYGDCEPGSDGGCSTPLSIQIWRACNRSLDDYELAPGTPYPHEKLTVRGTDAALFEGDRVEVYAGSVTIVIFASEELALRAAEALRPLNAAAEAEMAPVTGAGGPLPASDPGPDCASGAR
jgi:hypothetical protein